MCQEQTLRFETYGVENGLPNEQILDILEDSFGFIWLATIDGLVKFDGYDFKGYRHVPGDNSSLASSIVHQLLEDSEGNIWVVTEGELSLYHRETDNFELLLSAGDLGPSGNAAQVVFEDKDHTIWAGTANGLFRFNQQDCSLLPVASPEGVVENINIRCIVQDSKGRIWVGGDHGLQKLDTHKNSIEAGFLNSKNLSNSTRVQYIKDIEEDKNGCLWLATSAGAKIWDPDEKRLLPVPQPDSLANQGVYDILIDRNQNIWLAFQYKGLAFIDHKNHQTRLFQHSPYMANGLANDQLYSLMQDRADNLWIGTTLGCQKIKLSSVKFPVYQVRPGMEANENNIYRVHQDKKGRIWTTTLNGKLFYAPVLGTNPQALFPGNGPKVQALSFYYSGSDNMVWAIHAGNGVYAFNESKWAWQRMDLGDTINTQLNTVLFEDVHDPGILWIGNALGLCQMNRRTNQRQWFNPKEDIPSVTPFVHNMVQLPDGNILVNAGEFSTGTLALFDPVSKRFRPLIFSKDDPARPAIISVRNFALTKKYGVWMATPTGLVNYNVETGNCRTLTSKDGLPTTSVMAALSDEKDNIWVAFDGWLSKYMPTKDSIISFDVRAEMPGFYSGSFSKGPDGRLFFGGSSGFMAFHPDSVRFDTTPPHVVLTGFKVLNQPRHFGTSPELIRHITLFHRDNIFSFKFTALDFIDSKNIRYKYKLEGFNKEWIDAGPERTATYTNLDADSYTFRVIACNGDGVWNEKGLTVKLTITPPLWATWWAKILYVLAAGSLLYGIWRYELKRKLEHAETLRLQELDAVKTNLYTNITHEFRTPLTVISGMAGQIEQNPQEWLGKGVEMIKRNSNNLLLLVNQMLDLRKLESGNMSVNMVQADVVAYLKYLLESFHSQASAKNLTLRFETEHPGIWMDYDPEKLREVVANLVSNAIKFTPSGGELTLRVDLTNFQNLSNLNLQVKDTGIGIPPEKLPHIFDRFYQVDPDSYREGARRAEGTGIGLTLTKELVKLLGGSISVESQPGEGTTFKVVLPVSRKAAFEVMPPSGSFLEATPASPPAVPALEGITPAPTGFPLNIRGVRGGLPLVLIIEDNADVVQYLSACLEQDYSLAVARNGKEGIDKAIECVPDLIISDVMMPEKDGFEVCRTLKSDERTSHIPVVMLTAKADIASKIEGLESGADAYLAKPFNKQELLVRMRKLMDIRQKLRQHYLAFVTTTNGSDKLPEGIGIPPENTFLQKVKAVVEQHLDDVGFDLAQFSRAVAMSMSQLNRKMVALTGLSPNRFVRHLRLTKAKALLLATDEHVSAIAYNVGFDDPDYFARIFKQEFGLTPTAYRECKGKHIDIDGTRMK
ncbi:MAG: response regulator [Bacteroidetes bacterium]|nr:response regulator [Bacteroidota bacterium]